MSDYQGRNGRNNDIIYWLAAIVFLATGIAAPIGFLMIVLKLLGGNRRRRGRHPYYTQQEGQGPMGSRTVSTESRNSESVSPVQKRSGQKDASAAAQSFIRKLSSKGKKMTVAGAVLSAIFGFASITTATGSLWMLPDIAWYLEAIVPVLCFFAAGLGLLWAGLRRRKQAHRYRSYLAMIGQRKVISVSSLSAATGSSAAKVRDDLEDMLDEGLFPAGYLDYGGDRLVLSGEGLEEEPPKQEEPPKEAPREEDAILAEIRAVNDAVDNPKLSQQIDRIGVITAKILEYQRNRPEKAPQLHSFLSYYLPTTLKILRAYSQLEDQEVSGENITSAMERIEGMMDKVVEGFEKQLDLLFQGDAMDITTDVEVLERMLAKDGLSDQEGLTLGL